VKPKGTSFEKKRGPAGKTAPSASRMDFLLQRCGIRLSDTQLEQLWRYHQLLRQFDAELNLTRIHNFENMVVKLYADSILPSLQYPQLPSPLLDLGTGPGMPGIPLKIFRPDLHILLAESRQQRVDFLKTVVEALHLPGLEVIERGIAPDFDRPVAGVITRAVECIADTLARVSGCLEKDGLVLFMKGPRCDEEMERAARDFCDDYDLAEDIAYRIPHSPHRRRLVCYRRKVAARKATQTSDTPARYRIREIESESNPVFKDLKKLLTGRGVKKGGKTLVCGRRLVAEAMRCAPERCRAWIGSGNRHEPPAEAPHEMEWLQLSPQLFGQLDPFGTRTPILLYDLPEIPVWDAGNAASGCSLLIPFQDPENVGAVIRSAAAFAVARIVLLAESANPFHPKAIRASAGTALSANLYAGPSLNDLSGDLPVVALAAPGRPIANFAFPESFCLLPGMEGPGLDSRWLDNSVSIPMAENVESLNAATATAITLYEWRRQLKGE